MVAYDYSLATFTQTFSQKACFLLLCMSDRLVLTKCIVLGMSVQEEGEVLKMVEVMKVQGRRPVRRLRRQQGGL